MKSIFYFSTVVLMLLGPKTVLCQQVYSVDVAQYTEEAGLRARESNKMLIDQKGFVWIGSDEGLQRFDGYNFKWYNKRNTDGKIAYINGIIEDDEGWLWLLRNAPGQILFFHPETEKVLTAEERFGHDFPINIHVDSTNALSLRTTFGLPGRGELKNKLFFGVTNPAALITYDSKEGFQYFPTPYLEKLAIKFIDSNNHLWTSEKNIIYKISPEGQIIDTYASDEKDIFFEYFSEYKGEVFYNKRTLHNKETYSLYKINSFNQPQEVKKIPAGHDWINYRLIEDQIWILDLSGWKVYDMERSDLLFELSYEDYHEGLFQSIEEIVPSSNNRMWVLSRLGLYKIDAQPSRFKNYFSFGKGEQKPMNNSARGIFVNDNSVYVNFEFGGLVRFSKRKPEQWELIDNSKIIIPGVETVYNGRPILGEKESLISGHPNLIQELNTSNKDRKSIEFSSEVKTEGANAIWSIFKDRDGWLWLGASHGLAYKAPDDVFLRWYVPKSDSVDFNPRSSEILNIIEGPNGMIWLCSRYGLFLFDPQEKKMTARYWTDGQGAFQLPSDDVLYIYQDEEEIRWIGTRNGLIKWDVQSGEKRLYTREDGFPDHTIYAIFEDDHQHLWLSTNYGIIQFDKKTARVNSYFPKDGLPHHEFNRISQFQDKNGTIYFGTMNGVTAFHPDDFYEFKKESSPHLAITGFQQFDGRANKLINLSGELRQTKTIIMRPDDRYFRLEFALLSFNKKERLQYAWKLDRDGEKSAWNYQQENTLQLGRLPYGQHQLFIKGQDSNGQWSPKELLITIRSLRPFYLQPWFVGLSVLSLTGIFIAWYRNRIKNYRKRQALLEKAISEATSKIEQQTDELREMDKLKSRLYTNITHEFRTPLTVISGMADRIIQPAQAQKLIKRNAQSLLRLVNQLLDLAKIESKQLELNLVQADVVPFIQYLSESFQSYAESKNIQLVTYMETDQLIMDFDEKKLHSIFSNLLSNAIKFTPEGGKIILHLRKDAGQMILKIRDTGIGIPKEKLPYIFNRFYQVDDSYTRQGEGTGIGLTLVKELVELMNGIIEVKSKVEQGTEFILSIPITQNQPLVDSSISKEDVAHSAPISTIPLKETEEFEHVDLPLLLLIEDNRDVATYIQTCLVGHYQLILADNGAVGIEKAIEIVPDIIITDVMMPLKDGLEVCEALKNDVRTSHIPIVMLTARADLESKIEGLSKGADAYLAKPFNQAELMVRLEKLIELRKKLMDRYQQFSSNENTPIDDSHLEDVFLKKLRLLIIDKMMESDFSIDRLCREMTMSRMQLHRKLKALTNYSTSIFIRKIRLQKAKELLSENGLNVSEVAYSVGYDNPKYFSRLFSEEYGVPPSEYYK